MELVKRKRDEVEGLRDDLLDEFKHWESLARDGQQLEKHHTQIERLADRLRGLMAGFGEPSDDLAGLRRLLAQLLGTHRVWDFFRAKLALRYLTWLRDHLRCLDELAWAAYLPAREAAVAARTVAGTEVREPPLVYLTGDHSPYAQARGTAFVPPGLREELDRLDFLALLRRLPVPVIGIPWSQSRNLPSALVIPHEVGHLIEADLNLGESLDEAIAAAAPEYPAAWQAWRSELFADLWAVLTTGPAYAGLLALFLADEPQAVTEEQRTTPTWTEYPPVGLRMELVHSALRLSGPQKGHGGSAWNRRLDAAQSAWRELYPAHAMSQFEPDGEKVIGAMLDKDLPPLGQTLRDLPRFGAEDLDRSERVASRITRGEVLPERETPLCLMVGVALAYASAPAAVRAADEAVPLSTQIVAACPPGVRLDPADGGDAERRKADWAAGGELVSFFGD